VETGTVEREREREQRDTEGKDVTFLPFLLLSKVKSASGGREWTGSNENQCKGERGEVGDSSGGEERGREREGRGRGRRERGRDMFGYRFNSQHCDIDEWREKETEEREGYMRERERITKAHKI
jgi:hypothetical protein